MTMIYGDRALAQRFQICAFQNGIEETAKAMGIKTNTLNNWLNNGIPRQRMDDVRAWVERQIEEGSMGRSRSGYTL
jgi:hypothetical protein